MRKSKAVDYSSKKLTAHVRILAQPRAQILKQEPCPFSTCKVVVFILAGARYLVDSCLHDWQTANWIETFSDRDNGAQITKTARIVGEDADRRARRSGHPGSICAVQAGASLAAGSWRRYRASHRGQLAEVSYCSNQGFNCNVDSGAQPDAAPDSQTIGRSHGRRLDPRSALRQGHAEPSQPPASGAVQAPCASFDCTAGISKTPNCARSSRI